MGNRRPSQFLRHLRSIVPDMPDNFLHASCLADYPPTYKSFSLASLRVTWMLQTSRCSRLSRQHLRATHFCNGPRTSPARWQELTAKLTHFRSSSTNCCLASRSPSQDEATPTLCWYHRCYGAWALKCTKPCSYGQPGKTTADINSGTCLCYNHRPLLHHGQA
jgi:hypothetical protein